MFIFHCFYLHFEAEKYEPTADVPEWRKPNISVSPFRRRVHRRPQQLSENMDGPARKALPRNVKDSLSEIVFLSSL